MRRWCACLLLVAGCLIGAAAASQGPESDDGLDLLRNYLDGLDTLSADFTQAIVNRDLEPIDESGGRVVLKKPGRFRWDYREPYERVISADGERVWLYEADLEQVTIRRLEAGLYGDCEPVGEGVMELRLFFGPGYRVYFGEEAENLVILLCGGDKSTQRQDIETAKRYWKEHQEHD